MGSMYSVVSMVTVETVAKGLRRCWISDARYLAGYMFAVSWPIWYRLDHMHIKAGLGHAMLATKMPDRLFDKDGQIDYPTVRYTNVFRGRAEEEGGLEQQTRWPAYPPRTD
jgi:hypothetical protein